MVEQCVMPIASLVGTTVTSLVKTSQPCGHHRNITGKDKPALWAPLTSLVKTSQLCGHYGNISGKDKPALWAPQ